MEKSDKIYVSGHRGMVGSAIVRELHRQGYQNIVTRTHQELDLTCQAEVNSFFEKEKPDYAFLAAAKVGGIMANIQSPATFLYDNVMMEANTIDAAKRTGVKKLLFLASSCIYPRLAPQPMREEYLLDGKVEPTNEGYAIAKITGIKLCEMYRRQYHVEFISMMPCNLFGYNDNFDAVTSHVVPALIKKIHAAKINDKPYVEIWGSGNARRELLFSDDLANGIVFVMNSSFQDDFLNIGMGVDISIRELAELIRRIIGYKGDMRFDLSKPDGMPQKLMDVSKIRDLGWKYSTELADGLLKTYQYYLTLDGVEKA